MRTGMKTARVEEVVIFLVSIIISAPVVMAAVVVV